MEIKLIDRWDDIEGKKYLTVAFNNIREMCDIKQNDNKIYIMHCHNGNDVYLNDSCTGHRNLMTEESEQILEFAKEQFKIERELDNKFERK